MRILMTAAVLAMSATFAFADGRPPAFPSAPAFPESPTKLGCGCNPCECGDRCECLARSVLLATTGLVADAPSDTDRRLAALEKEVASLRAALATRGPSLSPFPVAGGVGTEEVITPGGGRVTVQADRSGSSFASPRTAGQYVTRQVCSNGTCRTVTEFVPGASVRGDNFIDTDEQPGGGASSQSGSVCASGTCGTRGGWQPILRVNGGPGPLRALFGGCR